MNGEEQIMDISQQGKAIGFTCKKCQHKNAFVMPQCEIANQMTFSAAIFVHENPQFCEQCGCPYQFVAKEVVVTKFGIYAMKAKSDIIAPPSGIFVPGGGN